MSFEAELATILRTSEKNAVDPIEMLAAMEKSLAIITAAAEEMNDYLNTAKGV